MKVQLLRMLNVRHVRDYILDQRRQRDCRITTPFSEIDYLATKTLWDVFSGAFLALPQDPEK